MAGLLPSFLSSSQLEIHLGNDVLAYCQSLSFNDSMVNIPVGGIGAFSYHALEPVDYSASGSMVITHYSNAVFEAIKALDPVGKLPENLQNTSLPKVNASDNPEQYRDGNSLLVSEFFNPVNLLISRTFDIKVYERTVKRTSGKLGLTQSVVSSTTGDSQAGPLYILKNCRASNFRLGFSPGSLVQQVFSFVCMAVIDGQADDSITKTLPIPPPQQ